MIKSTSQTETDLLIDLLIDQFSAGGETDLAAICRDEGLRIIVDDYQHHFDGILVWDGTSFNIHLNKAKGNFITSKRGRFTLAHELAHYFREEHREGIRRGTIPLHGSLNVLAHTEKMEREADEFATRLLMPQAKLRSFTGGKPFSFDRIKEISDYFGVSLTAAALRFLEIGTHEVMIVFSRNNIVEWTCRSEDFPKLANRFKRGDKLPPTTVAGESFLKEDAQYTGIEMIDLEDWFEYRGWEPNRQLYEQCFYSDQYSFVMSLIWFK